MTKKQLIEQLMAIEGNPQVSFRFVYDEEAEHNDLDSTDCQVDFVFEEDGKIFLSDTDPEDEGDDGDEIIDAEVVNS